MLAKSSFWLMTSLSNVIILQLLDFQVQMHIISFDIKSKSRSQNHIASNQIQEHQLLLKHEHSDFDHCVEILTLNSSTELTLPFWWIKVVAVLNVTKVDFYNGSTTCLFEVRNSNNFNLSL